MDELDQMIADLEGANGSVDVSQPSNNGSDGVPKGNPLAEEIIRERTADIMDYNEDKRFNPDGSQSYDLAKLRGHQQEILRLLSTGMRAPEIASLLGVHKQTVSNIQNSELGQAMSRFLHTERNVTIAKTAERIDALAPKAAEVFEDILFDPNVDRSLQYRVAKDTLKANGIMVDRKIIVSENSWLSPEEIAKLKGQYKKDFGDDIEDANVVRETDDVEA